MHGPKPYKFTGFGDMHGPKPYKFIGFASWLLFRFGLGPWMSPNPMNFIGLGAMDVTKPYEFMGLGAMEVIKPYEFIRFGLFWFRFGVCLRGASTAVPAGSVLCVDNGCLSVSEGSSGLRTL